MRVVILGGRRLEVGMQPTSVARPHVPTEAIRRRERAYWQERGWIRQGDTYVGSYQTPFGAFRGTIDDNGYGQARFYLLDVPRVLRGSPHWRCFQPRGDRGFHVHMGIRPADMSSGILAIERLLTEAFEGRT
jgi:hypothetical protein